MANQNGTLFSERDVRNAFIATGVGMVALVVFFLVLATSQPQGTFQTADDQAFQATLTAATENLEGYELVGETRARIDIDHAMQLVAERGVNIQMTNINTEMQAESAPDPVGDDVLAQGEGPSLEEKLTQGETTYSQVCSACHQPTGAGVPGAFPPLNGGHAARLAQAEGGYDYLINTVLYGLQGAIEVGGMTYNGIMTPHGFLPDDQIAGVLTYVTRAWDNEGAVEGDIPEFFAEDVAALRDAGLTGADVYETRPAVND